MIVSVLFAVTLLTNGVQNVLASHHTSAAHKAVSNIKGAVNKGLDQLNSMITATTTTPVQSTHCNNTTTAGQFTNFFNNIGGCPVKVLFESPNSVQLQYSDGNGYDGYVTQLETAYHWYEINHQDDGTTTTIVLAPLR